MILGIPFEWEHFWSAIQIPPSCPTHGPQPTPFCGSCGKKVEAKEGRKATPVFAAYCEGEATPPEHVWEDWIGNSTLGLFNVGTKKNPALVLGTSLATMSSYDLWERGEKGEQGPTLAGLQGEMVPIAKLAEKLGLDPTRARLYLDME